MKKLLLGVFALTALSVAVAAPVSMEDQSQLKPAPAKKIYELGNYKH